MGLRVGWVPPPSSPDPGHVGTWHPQGPLPPLETTGRVVVTFYTPHPDDETLSMALPITQAIAAGKRVIVVAMTDGLTTGAAPQINARLARESRPPLTASDIGTARVEELRHATRALGVAPDDLFLAHLDAPTSDCGADVSVGEAHDVMSLMAQRYPGATHVTMSDVAERNTDHLACGIALRQLTHSGAVAHAEWTVSRLWWTLPSPAAHWVVSGSADIRRRVLAADRAYSLWEPDHQSYAIGATSVATQFQAEELDPRSRVHE